jgi:hypothetical protein
LRTQKATADIAPKKGPVDALQLGFGIDRACAEWANGPDGSGVQLSL